MQIEIVGTITDKITEPKKCSIEFFADYIKYILEYKSSRLNSDTELWEDKYIYNHYTFIREHISATLLFFSNDSEIWFVEIGVTSGQSVAISFKTYEDANVLHKQLLNWLYNTKS